MKKLCVILLILVTSLVGCQANQSQESSINGQSSGSNGGINTESGLNHTEENDVDRNNITPIENESNEWTSIIIKENELTVDLNLDGYNDYIRISYEEIEGSILISKFEIKIAGESNTYSIENYDASFEKIELIDLNKDSIRDVLFMFDTRGGGGQGTHDIFLFDHNEITKVSSALDANVEVEAGNNVDNIYFMETVTYRNEERLLVRQYMYGQEGHADGIGEVISIVSLSPEEDSFTAETSWVEIY